ncbi:tyrosine-type recombinase/integrase [Halobaculum sp. P14]|uniref:tyrosine-type recombinase/integrase n=1 Tax=Halobaculum sp. P14 TaxID=3421638 RepID=UPI003EBAE8DD
MNLREHDEREDKKVWLSTEETERFLATAENTQKRIAFGLGARCGLRSGEWLDVTPRDVVDTDAGTMLRVWEGKGDKFRETPIPDVLATRIRVAGEEQPDEPVLSVTSTRTLRRWVDRAGDQLAEETGEVGWRELSTHDLRRTWATALADAEVDPLLALDWGGWEDLETFLEHYKGVYSPAAQRRAREKVSWL